MNDRTETLAALGRRLRLGVVGGGPGSFIGGVQRGAALLTERYDLVAGVLSSNPEKSRAAGRELGFAADRCYADIDALLAGEQGRDDGIDVLAVMTPNDSHYALSCAALAQGLDVICEKPLCNDLDQALDLVRRVRASGRAFCVAYCYTGYPLVRQARAMMQAGLLGELRMVQVNYVQGHLATLSDAERGHGENWHMNPDSVGPSLVLGDIGTHAFHMAAYVSGRQPVGVAADVTSVVPGRSADDYAGALLRFDNGARGVLWITQAAAGAEHGLAFRVFGAQGGLEWHQERPNELLYRPLGEPVQLLSRDGPGLLPAGKRAGRIAFGHPEGYREAFATLYDDLAEAVAARLTGQAVDPLVDFPGVEDGARGVKFIQAALASSRADGTWTDCSLPL